MLTYRTSFGFWLLQSNGSSLTISVILSEGLFQAEAVEHFDGDNDHGNHEF